MRSVSKRDFLIAGAAFVALSVLTTLPLVSQIGTRLPVNMGDPLLNSWILSSASEQLAHVLRGGWQTLAYYPYTYSAAFSDSLLGVAVVVAPVEWATRNPVLTYNLAILLSLVLTGLATFTLVRRLTGNAAAAFVAGCAFAFSPYRSGQLEHLQNLSVWWMVLTFWAFDVLEGTRRPVAGVAVAVFFVLQVLASGYSVFYGSLGLAVLTAAWLLSVGRSRRVLAGLAVVVLIGGIALLPFARAMLRVWGTHAPERGVVASLSVDVSNLLRAPRGTVDARVLGNVNQPEVELFPGVLATGLLGVGLWTAGRSQPRVRRAVRTYGALAVAGLLLALGPSPQAWGHELLPYGPFALFQELIPLASVVRSPARFGVLTLLGVAVIGGYGVSRLLTGRPARVQWTVALLIGAVMTWEGSASPIRLVPLPDIDTPVYAWLAQQPAGALLELPVALLSHDHNGIVAQYATLRHHHPIVNGTGRFVPPLHSLFDSSASPLAQLGRAREVLPLVSGLHIRYVFIRPASFLDPALATAALDAFHQDRVFVESGREFPDGWMFTIRPGSAYLPSPESLRRLSAADITASASTNPEAVGRAIDGDTSSRWLSGRPQDGTEWFSVRFTRSIDAGVVRIATGRSLGDYPRDLEIIGLVQGQPGPSLFRGSVLGPIGEAILRNPEEPELAIALPSNRIDGLLLRQHSTTSWWFWSIDELMIDERLPGGMAR